MSNNRIPVNVLYTKVAQKLGGKATPKRVREISEALQEVIYEELKKNDECYWYGFGNFRKDVNARGGRYEDKYDFSTGEIRPMYINQKYVVSFDMVGSVVDGLNLEEESLPRFERKRKYTKKEYQDHRNEVRRKPKTTRQERVCDWWDTANKKGKKDGEEE